MTYHVSLEKRPQPVPAIPQEAKPAPSHGLTMAQMAARERKATRELFGAQGWRTAGGNAQSVYDERTARKAIASLSNGPRNVDEIAETEGVTRGTVLDRINKARKMGAVITNERRTGVYTLVSAGPLEANQ